MQEVFTGKLANHLKQLRLDKGLSLDQLATETEISRASLSRLENGSVSPTTEVLSKLCVTYKIKMSKLLAMLEGDFEPLIRDNAQLYWKDPDIGFTRRSVSPSTDELSGEILKCEIEPNTTITYDRRSIPSLEHHLLMLEGSLCLTVGEDEYQLSAQDCLRYISAEFVEFKTPKDSHATYLVFIVGG
jgi:transcriptional regulator with XRE-family HTH domain